MNKTGSVLAGVVIAGAVVGAIYGVASFEKVDVGNVGVVYSMSDGVQEDVLTTGYHFINPLLKVKQFPVKQQQLVLSNNPADYNKDEHQDWHVDAPADGGMVKLNVSINYNFEADKVVKLYENFGGMDGEDIVENRVQNQIISYIKDVTPQFSVMDIYSEKRSLVGESISKYLTEKLLDEYGIKVSSVNIIDVQLDDELMKKVKAKEQAKQDAEKAELDLVTAQKQAETNKVKAEGEAAVAIEKAKGEAEANKLKSQSITPELIKMKEAEARLKHGWVTVNGAGTVVTDKK
ncbi:MULTISPECIES: prohibitin family protein [Erysipelotrichaceae]|uniref:prohibitin family protein n=1 Tax=Erysipelotrichaceae TaxID=128827 RepID=UPI000E50550C|nr:prohibitin family protein [Absiella sp. AM27-20]RHU03266.1 prohibitin family protein [Absiella sp. AM27-20]